MCRQHSFLETKNDGESSISFLDWMVQEKKVQNEVSPARTFRDHFLKDNIDQRFLKFQNDDLAHSIQ